MAHATFDDQFLQQLKAAGLKPAQMGEYRKSISFPFEPVRPATRKGIELNSNNGLTIASDVEQSAAFLRGKGMNSGLLCKGELLNEGGFLNMGQLQEWLGKIPGSSHPMMLMQGAQIPKEFDNSEELENEVLEHIFGKTPFVLGAAPNDGGIGKMRVAIRIEDEEERYAYEGPQTSLDYLMEKMADDLATLLALEFLEVLFNVGPSTVKPFALNTRPTVPRDVELLKHILRLAAE